MSNSFPNVKKITRRCFAVIVACFMALAAFPLHAETPMPSPKPRPFTGQYNFQPLLQHLAEHTGYEQALKRETSDGLITIDFRGLKKPHFLTHWPDKDIWKKDWAFIDYWEKGFREGIRGYYNFNWDAATSSDGLHGNAYVCKDYELAQTLFLLGVSTSSSKFPMPYIECNKRIGTFCMSSHDNKTIFFFYKNIYIKIRNASSGHLAEQTAQWLSDVLKGFPLIPMNAPLQFRREPYATPVFEYLGSEAPAAGDSSRMGADGGDDDN